MNSCLHGALEEAARARRRAAATAGSDRSHRLHRLSRDPQGLAEVTLRETSAARRLAHVVCIRSEVALPAAEVKRALHRLRSRPCSMLYPERRDTSPELLGSGCAWESAPRPSAPIWCSTWSRPSTARRRSTGAQRASRRELDRRLFHQLRTQVDAVMVGAGTSRAERYGRMRRARSCGRGVVSEGLAREPLAIIVSGPAGPARRPAAAPGAGAGGGDRHRLGCRAPGDRGGRIEYVRTGDDLSLLMAKLRDERGVRSILCEGGPTLNFHLLAAGLVDELFLTLNAKLERRRGRPHDRRRTRPRGAGRARARVGGRGRRRPLHPLANRASYCDALIVSSKISSPSTRR